MKEEIKELRVKIDGLAQLTRELKPIKSGIYGEACDCDCHNSQGMIMHMTACCNNGVKFGTEKEGPSFNSNEINKAYDSIILAKAWLGKILGELGESTPYANDGKRKTVQDIEPTADKAKVVPGLRNPVSPGLVSSAERVDTWELNGRPMNDYDTMSHIEKVDWLREDIKNIIDTTTNFSEDFPEIELEQGFVYKYLSEARFWLGFELQRIRENEPK